MGNGWKRSSAVLAAAVLAFIGPGTGLAYAQSTSDSSGSTVCCCCCLPVLLVLAAICLGNNSKSKRQPQPVVAQETVPPQTQPQIIYKEKEIIREVVKVRCEYCGSLVDITEPKCQSCGAPVKR